MTKTKIIAELRKSATSENLLYWGLPDEVWNAAGEFRSLLEQEQLYRLADDDCRTFFLLCAHALEDA